jgi:transcriptional regulator with XRE-family HTH domain
MLSRETPSRGGEVGALLRHWRTERRKSQLEVALEAGVSQRHLSFIESGRSAPGRDALLAIAGALDIPLRERNELLLASGFAPMYSDAPMSEPEMRSITAAVNRMLQQQEPYPAVLMDRYWNVLSANDATSRFFGHFIDMKARVTRRNLLHLMFDPAGMRPFIHDWENVSRSLLERVRREAVGRVVDARTQELLDALLAYPALESTDTKPSAMDNAADLPMIPLSFVTNSTVLKYFSMVTTIGTPQSIASQELRVECIFPVDESTEKHHLAILRGAENASR